MPSQRPDASTSNYNLPSPVSSPPRIRPVSQWDPPPFPPGSTRPTGVVTANAPSSSGGGAGGSSSRGNSPGPDYRSRDGNNVPWSRRKTSGEEDRTGTSGLGGIGSLLGGGGGGGPSSSRNASSESLDSSSGFAGRGAGASFASNGNRVSTLPPINTHLQPQHSSSPQSGTNAPPPPLQQPPPSAGGSSNNSHNSSRHSYKPIPRPINLPPNAASGLSTSLPHSPGFAPGSSSSSSSRPSPREPQFPPTKQHSNSSTGTSSSQRSPTSYGQSDNNLPHPHPPPAPPGSRPNSTSGSSHSHNHPPPSDGYDRDRERERERERDKQRERERRVERSGGQQACAKCELPMTGQFVRALGTVYHLDCFRCQDCNKVVANKFFPVDATDGSGKQLPLCETDYFRRLNLLCSKCGAALRGSYITALDMKFHVEHFTCSVCPTVFGPQDSYYEHGGSVYCHFHYSTRFAVKCTGCRTAILKQFVEINRNSTDEHWHPECYMIHKFWNIKLAPSPPVKAAIDAPLSTSTTTDTNYTATTSLPSTTSLATEKAVESSLNASGPPSRALDAAEYLEQEETETPQSLKSRQKLMEEQVYRIWTVLSAFEESSAACISEMLRHVSSGHYIEGVRMAEKFVLHVETLFSAIDDLSVLFKAAGTKEISHVREARMLCKKVVNFFSLLSHTHETGARKMSITQELLSLVTGLAHYLKILIRIALTAALKLEREFGNQTAIGQFLARLDRLARDPEASKFSTPPSSANATGQRRLPAPSSNGGDSNSTTSTVVPTSTSRTYGYKSLTRADGSTLVGQGEATTDLCEGCHLTVEEECARFGTSLRWHLPCLRCTSCGKIASKERDGEEDGAWFKEFRIEGEGAGRVKSGGRTYCGDCAPLEGAREGFEYVTRLEQYAFLLCVALNKLYALLKQRGVVPSSPTEEDSSVEDSERSLYDTYRDSTDIKRMKSVNLDRKLSSTTARTPKRSIVVQSPSGRVAQPNDSSIPLFAGKPPVPSRKDQPLVDPVRGTMITPPVNAPRPPLPSMPVSQRSLPPEATTTAATLPIPPPTRPELNRATTAIHIVDEQTSADSHTHGDGPALGGFLEPTQDEQGITLADLPTVMEAERAREQRQYLPPRTGTLLSELSALEYFIVRHVAALMLASETSAFREVAPLDDLLEIIDAKKNTFWGKLFKGGGKEKKIDKKKGVFGIPLDVLVERNGADSMHGAGPGSLRVPSFVDDVISAMKQMDMSVEGIFRKNGNIRRLRDLSEALDRDSGSVNLSDDNPVQLAALLKKFLRDLPDPLITFKLFHLFIAAQRVDNLEERKKIMHLCCCLLPKSHRDTMEVLFVFLKWVASFSHVDEETGSKMDLLNLATVISPNILYSKGKDPAKDESFSSVRAVHELLEFQDDFWQVPVEFVSILSDQDLFNNPSQLTSKEILARAENHVRAHAKGGYPQQSFPVRGEVRMPQRPDFNQAWSAPVAPTGLGVASPPASRPGSTNPPGQRGPNERPISFSTTTGPIIPGIPLRHPQPRSPYGSPPGLGAQGPPPAAPYLPQQHPHQQQQQQQQHPSYGYPSSPSHAPQDGYRRAEAASQPRGGAPSNGQPVVAGPR